MVAKLSRVGGWQYNSNTQTVWLSEPSLSPVKWRAPLGVLAIIIETLFGSSVSSSWYVGLFLMPPSSSVSRSWSIRVDHGHVSLICCLLNRSKRDLAEAGHLGFGVGVGNSRARAANYAFLQIVAYFGGGAQCLAGYSGSPRSSQIPYLRLINSMRYLWLACFVDVVDFE